MGTIHDVYDSDTRFIINPITRVVKNISSPKTTLIQKDHNSERFSFEIDRYVEGHDMSLCNKVEINYINIDSATKEQNEGLYIVEDLQIDKENEEKVVFSWLITEQATMHAGLLSFLIMFRCMDNAETKYRWSTNINSDISVSKGIDNGNVIAEEYADVLAAWEKELFDAEDSAIKNIENKANSTMAAMEKFSIDTYNSFKNNVDAKNTAMTNHANETYAEFNNDVNEKAARTLETIPEEYSDLDAEVKDGRLDYKGNQHANIGLHIRNIGKTQELSVLKSQQDLSAIEIEESVQNKIFETCEGEKTEGAFFDYRNGAVQIASWNYYTFNVNPCEVYLIHSYQNLNAKLITFLDYDNKIIGYLPTEEMSGAIEMTEEIIVPYNAQKMVVNEMPATLQAEVKKFKNVMFEKAECRFAKAVEQEVRNIEIEGFLKSNIYSDIKETGIYHAEKFWARSNIVYDSVAWAYYEFEVKYPEIYSVKGFSVSSAPVVLFLDKNSNILESYPSAESSGEFLSYEVQVPINAVKMIVNEQYQSLSSIEKYVSIKYSSPTKARTDFLEGKSLVACGDSITEGIDPEGGYFKNYAELVAERNNMTYHNCGRSGSTMTNIADRNPFSGDRYLNLPDFDYLTLWFGWNDGAYAPLGTIDDEVDTTFYGAYKKVLSYLIKTYPTKKIGLVVPYMHNSDFQQAVRDVSELYGVPCLDLLDYKQCSKIWDVNTESGLARTNALTYDTTHPNQVGYEFISTMYENFLRSL